MSEGQINEILKFDPAMKQPEQKSIADEILKFDPLAKPEDKPVSEQPQPVDEDSFTWKQALVEGFHNIPSSALSYGTTMLKGAGKLLKGAIAPKEASEKIVSADYGKLFDDIVSFMKDRYGSTENFKQTIAKDPVGPLGDVASLISGVGGISKVAGAVGGISKLSEIGAIISKTGMAMEPLNLARGIAALPLKLIPESVPVGMYQSAVKFGTTLSAKERLEITRTALKTSNQIMPTEKGMGKLRGMIDAHNEKVNTILNNAVNNGDTIPVDRLYQGLETVKDEFKKISDEPLVWDTAFKGIKKQWDEALNIGPVRTPAEVQKIKTRIYKDLESFYEKQKATPAKVELRKAIARNARESLETIVPEIKQLNKNEGALIELWDAVESKANRITNRDFINIGLPIKMGAGSGIGYMLSGSEGAAIGTVLGFTLGVFDTPQVKAKFALVMNRLREKGITVRPTTAAMKLGLFQTGREK